MPGLNPVQKRAQQSGQGWSSEFAEGSDHSVGSEAFFDRGHIDHLAIGVADTETFELLRSRLVGEGATDGTVTDFGLVRTVWFRDPDGMGSEIAMGGSGSLLAFEDRIQEAYEAAP